MNRLGKSIWLAGITSIVAVQPVWADVIVVKKSDSQGKNQAKEQPITNSAQINEVKHSTTNVEEWLKQIAQASIVQVTEVRLNSTNTGLEVILITSDGQLPISSPSIAGNALIADISNAVLALPDGDEFLATKPAEGIASISLINLPGNRVRVAIALRKYVRTVFECGINTIPKSLKLLPALPHPILQYKPPMLDLIEVW